MQTVLKEIRKFQYEEISTGILEAHLDFSNVDGDEAKPNIGSQL